MISIAFQTYTNHVLETISSVDALNIGKRISIQRPLNIYFSAASLISNQLHVVNPLHVILNESTGFYRLYRSIAKCFGNLN